MQRITRRVFGAVLAGRCDGRRRAGADAGAAAAAIFGRQSLSACRWSRPPDGTFNPVSANVKMFGAIYSAESCSYDPARGVIVVPNRGVPQNVQTNNALGLVHQPRRLGPHRALDRHPESRRDAPR